MTTHSKGGFWRHWLIRFMTSVAFSVMFVLALMCVEESAPVRALDRWGADAVMQVYSAGAGAEGAPVLLVDAGAGATLDTLAGILSTMAAYARPIALGLDIVVVDDPCTAINIDGFVAALRRLRDVWGEATRIVLPAQKNQRLAQEIARLPWVHVADPDLVPDDDGVVRAAHERICEGERSADAALPTLAAAMVGVDPGANHGCGHHVEVRPILFEHPQGNDAGASSGIILVPREQLASHLGSHAPKPGEAYVLVGYAGPRSATDTFMTPLRPSEMPGVLVHANAVRTLAHPTEELSHHVKLAVEFLIAWVAGAVLAAYSGLCDWMLRRLPPHSLREGIATFLARGVLATVLVGAVIVVIGVFWTWTASGLVGNGLLIGALTPVVGAMLETLVHAGEFLVGPIERAIARLLTGRRAVAAALALLCLWPVAASADTCVQVLVIDGSLEDVRIEPPRTITSPQVRLEQFERVVIVNPRTKAYIERSTGGAKEQVPIPRDAGAHTVLPCPPRGGIRGAWDAFWGVINPTTSTQPPRPAALPIYRGLNSADQSTASGPLRELTNLTAASGTVPGGAGLAFAWAGGRAPYRISLQDQATGAPIGRGQTSAHLLWLPDWRPPAQPFLVIIRDAEGGEIRRPLLALPPAPGADRDIGDAVSLFETAPAYRLEALRRFVVRASQGDELAARAISAIQLSGAQE